MESYPAMLQIDAQYAPIPTFGHWAVQCHVNTDRWEHYAARVAKISNSGADVLRRSLEVLKTAAAIETGLIENLYELPTGFTITAATQVTVLEAAVNQASEKARPYIQSQLEAYDMVLDFATQQRPIAEAWVRELHAQICKAQETYKVRTSAGEQEQPLPKGTYKTMPNHVITPQGETHAYAPVNITNDEMHRLCDEMRSDTFSAAHPVLQASYAHYCLVRIHPFADGNGRVARALASVFTYRANSMPLLILVENRGEYLAALRAADTEHAQSFVNFIFERMLTALQIIEETIRTADVPPVEDVLQHLRQSYLTRGGFTHIEVDNAGSRLFQLYYDEVTAQLSERTKEGGFSFGGTADGSAHDLQKSNTRLPISVSPRRAIFTLNAPEPASVKRMLMLALEVPRDCGPDDQLFIVNLENGDSFGARMVDLMPAPTTTLQIMLRMSAQKAITLALSSLAEVVENTMRAKGFL